MDIGNKISAGVGHGGVDAGGSADCVIEVTGLRRRYGGAGRSAKSRTRRDGQRPESPPGGRKSFEAVRGVDFSVGRGELFALLGTNGAGKTSTLELLEGLAAPTSGRIRVLGHDPFRERRKVRPRIGVMLQEGGFPSELTPEETLRMWAGCTSGARPVAAALGAVGLERRKDVRVKQLSGGERRRLDLALALLGRPEVLFLDEPTTGPDTEARHETWELVRELRDSGTTIVLTTHYLEEAEELADRLAILHNGGQRHPDISWTWSPHTPHTSPSTRPTDSPSVISHRWESWEWSATRRTGARSGCGRTNCSGPRPGCCCGRGTKGWSCAGWTSDPPPWKRHFCRLQRGWRTHECNHLGSRRQ